jgi:hypothetical protein
MLNFCPISRVGDAYKRFFYPMLINKKTCNVYLNIFIIWFNEYLTPNSVNGFVYQTEKISRIDQNHQILGKSWIILGGLEKYAEFACWIWSDHQQDSAVCPIKWQREFIFQITLKCYISILRFFRGTF